MLKAEHLQVLYGETPAVDNVSFRIREGEWWTIVGPNGAGKSSLAGALGRTVPFLGSITFRDRDIRSFAAQEYARKVGMLSQNHPSVYGFTVKEVVSLGRYAWHSGFLRRNDPDGAQQVGKALELTGLSGMESRNMLTLSGGEQQRVFLAQVLCQDPELLILDEPANHLDLPYQKELFSLIGNWLKTPGRAAVTVMHDLSLARKYGSHALLMDRGRCAAQGKTGDVLTPDALRQAYGMDVYGWIRELLQCWE